MTPTKCSHTVQVIITTPALQFRGEAALRSACLGSPPLASPRAVVSSGRGCLHAELRRLHSRFIRSRPWASDAHVVRAAATQALRECD